MRLGKVDGSSAWIRTGVLAPVALVLLSCGGGAAPPVDAAAVWGPGRVDVRLAGASLGHAVRWRAEVDQMRGAVDRATVVIDGDEGVSLGRQLATGDDFECRLNEPQLSQGAIFKGEVVGVEPVYTSGGESTVVIHGFNRLHRLTHGRKTRVFEAVTDGDIVGRIAAEHDLIPRPSLVLTTRYDAVFQRNQTDLEFLRERARQIGFDVWVEDRELYFDRPVRILPVELAPQGPDGEGTLLQFHPRLSSSEQVQEAVVHGWDPVAQEPVTGRAQVPTVLLVEGVEGPRSDPLLGRTVEMDAREDVMSQVEADAAAWDWLDALTEPLLSAEVRCMGSGGLRAAQAVQVVDLDSRMDGQYFVQRATHRFGDREGGYVTVLSVRREDRGLYFIPEIDDEVLVAFEHGDIRQPIVVGSLWNDAAEPPSRR